MIYNLLTNMWHCATCNLDFTNGYMVIHPTDPQTSAVYCQPHAKEILLSPSCLQGTAAFGPLPRQPILTKE